MTRARSFARALRLALAAGSLLTVLTLGSLAFADDVAPPKPPAAEAAQVPPSEAEDAEDSRATSFQAVQGAQAEQVPGGGLLVAAYAVVLVLLLGYVARLGMMNKKTQGEVERLTRALDAHRKA
jgi:CcmD family protein